jgi:hypothetical protein
LGQALSSPYHFNLDLTDLSPGSHALRAVIYDRSLNQTTVSHEVNVAAPATSPPTQQPPATPAPATPTAAATGTATAVPAPPTATIADAPEVAEEPEATEPGAPEPVTPTPTSTATVSPDPSPEVKREPTAPLSPIALAWISYQAIIVGAAGVAGLLVGLVVWAWRRRR